MFLRVSSPVKVVWHSVGGPNDVALMACEMQEGIPDVELTLNLHFPLASTVNLQIEA